MSKNTIIVNLIGGQGTGKSTTMADTFAFLKHKGIDCEMVTEFAKELVWENRKETFKDELYIFAKQNHRLFRCNGKVDVIITDRPLIMTSVYNEYYGDKKKKEWNDALNEIVINTWNQYNNKVFFLERVKPYNSNGRNETEEEARNFDKLFKLHLNNYGVVYENILANVYARNVIGEKILKLL